MRLLNRSVLAAILLGMSALIAPLSSTPRVTARKITTPADVLYAAPGDLKYAYGPQGADLARIVNGDRPATATFTVTYNGFSPQAQAAFQAAVNIWSSVLTSPAPIRITANWTDLGSTGILGSAGPTALCTSTGAGAVSGALYATALADKLQGSQYCAALASTDHEIDANFNSTFASWEYGTSGTGQAGKYSFMTVVLHELGHGLGFFGDFYASGGVGHLLNDSNPSIYDRFATVGAGGSLLLNISRPSTTLGSQLVSDNTYWNGANAPNAKLETGNFTTKYGRSSDNGWSQGSSYSHADDLLYSGTSNGLMTFQLNSNEVYTDPGPVVRGMFKDEGWTVNSPSTVKTFGDFTGDGHADFAVFRPSTGVWFIQGLANTQWGLAGDIPVVGDWNGDGKSDVAVFRPANGNWYLQATGTTIQYGRAGDVPVPGDYNGDGTTDAAVFRQTDGPGGTFYIRNVGTTAFGLRGDIPVPADYDGDGKTDIAVYRPETGTWYVLNSSNGTTTQTAFGLPGDIPMPAKYDSDGKADYAVFRPSNGTWYFMLSGGGTASTQLGLPGDVPLAQDLDGDGIAELNVWRPSNGTFYTFNRITVTTGSQQLGMAGDIPAVKRPRVASTAIADFDGDGKADLSIFRNVAGVGYWYQRFSSNGTTGTKQWGLNGDVKVQGDYDGDHKADVAVYRPSNGVWYLTLSASNTTTQIQWGLSGDLPVPGDYDGDGKTDPAVYRPSTGVWYVLPSSANYDTSKMISAQWGAPGDTPLVGDFDGDGKADFAVFRPSTGVWFVKMTTTWYSADGTFSRQFGLNTDIPIVQDFDGDGRTDIGLFRGNGQWLAADFLSGVQLPARQLGLSTDISVSHDYDGDGIADVAVFRPANGTWFFTQSSNGSLQTFQWGLAGDQPVVRTKQ